jgi:hypothetical protein
MPIDNELIDNLLKDYRTPEEILGEGGLLKQLTKAVLERAMQAELTDHLGYERHDPAGDNSGNSRNGKSRKTLKAISATCLSKSRATATQPSTRRSSPRGRPALTASTTRFCRSTPAG